MSAHDVIRLVDILGEWDTGSGPRYRRMADALTASAERGLLDGMRLPAERRLAVELGVSRSTVVKAYGLLRDRGVATSRARSGTVVRPRGRSAGALTPIVDRLMDPGSDLIDLSFGAFPLDDLMRDYAVSFEEAHALAPLHGYAPQGLPALREKIAEAYREQGVPASSEEILVTAGAQEAISILAAVHGGPNQTVLVEPTTFSGALEAFVRTGATVEAIPSDVAGPRPDRLAAILEARPAALIYLVPNCHNPTGSHIAAGRRAPLLDVAREHGVPVVEDGALDDLRYDGTVLPLLQSLDPGNVLGLGALGKISWGGLRIGWVRAPRSEILRLTQAKGCWNIGGSVLDQLMAIKLLADRRQLADARRRQASERLDVLAGALAERLPGWRFERPGGGVSLWIELPAGSATEFAGAALRHGVAVATGPANSPGGGSLDRLRLCFVLPEELLREAVVRLERAWRSYEQDRLGADRVPLTV